MSSGWRPDEIVRKMDVPAEYFGEGHHRLRQPDLSTHLANAGRIHVYATSTFRLLGRFRYTGEGWGLTNDGKQLYMSDGSAQIRCLDPVSLRELRRITVHDGNRADLHAERIGMRGRRRFMRMSGKLTESSVSGPPTERSRAGSTHPVCLRQTTNANR